MIIKAHGEGMFCWADLSTSDPAAARKFYGSLFGWEFVDTDAGEMGIYTMCRLGGEDVGAMSGASPDEQKAGTPPHWNAYISVKSADETVGRAEKLGGKILAPAFDVMSVGRMAVIQDPSGAVFCAWQSKGHHGYSRVGENGAVCWNELMTRDPGAAEKFYTSLFGYKPAYQEFGPMKYTVFQNGERPAGGMMPIAPDMAQVPPHWLVYFQVGSCDDTARRASEAGGQVPVPPTDIPGVGRFAVILDPQQAVFGILQPPAGQSCC